MNRAEQSQLVLNELSIAQRLVGVPDEIISRAAAKELLTRATKRAVQFLSQTECENAKCPGECKQDALATQNHLTTREAFEKLRTMTNRGIDLIAGINNPVEAIEKALPHMRELQDEISRLTKNPATQLAVRIFESASRYIARVSQMRPGQKAYCPDYEDACKIYGANG